MRPDPVDAARALVLARFPQARQAWLAGSAARGAATPTSDLDVTVLLAATVVHRESSVWGGWPVELFVNTEASLRHFLHADLARRRPTMARLVGTGIALVDGDGGREVADECRAALAAGPGALDPAELELRRYALTDVRDDLLGEPVGPAGNAVAVAAWEQTAELRLAAAGAWFGSGKWLVRELDALDARRRTSHAAELDAALQAALAGDREALIAQIEGALAEVGGPLRDGFRRDAALPPGAGRGS